MIRAAIMGGLYVVAIAIGRRNTALVAIAFRGCHHDSPDPQIVHDVSFQLSFSATLGLVLLTPLLAGFFESLESRSPAVAEFPLTRMLNDVATMTLAATAFTLPVLAISFHRVSLAAPLANLFAVPAFVAVAATSGLAAVAGLVLPGDATYLSWLAWPPAAYMIAVVRSSPTCLSPRSSCAASTSSTRLLTTPSSEPRSGGSPGVRSSASNRRPRRLRRASRVSSPPGALAVVLVLASALLWLAATRPESGRLTVTFLDVGQGDAILIEGPQGHRILVDGGPSGEAITAALGRQLPFYDRRLDLVALTHPQQDHIGGLPAVLEEYSVSASCPARLRAIRPPTGRGHARSTDRDILGRKSAARPDDRSGRRRGILPSSAPAPATPATRRPLTTPQSSLRLTMGDLVIPSDRRHHGGRRGGSDPHRRGPRF